MENTFHPNCRVPKELHKEILALPDGRIIDGVHRLKLARKLGKEVPHEILDLSEDAAFALGIILNVGRRNLSPEQAKEARKHLRELALELRRQGKTQEEIAGLLGVPRPTVAWWLAGERKNVGTNNVSLPDCRVRIPKEQHEAIYERVKARESPREVAA